MEKIWIVIRREYLQRVRNRLFLVSTVLTPLVLAGLFVIPALVALNSNSESYTVWVFDPTSEVLPRLKSNDEISFKKGEQELEAAKQAYVTSKKDAILVLPGVLDKELTNVTLFASQPMSIASESRLRRQLSEAVRQYKIKKAGLSEDQIKQTTVDLTITSKKLSATGEKEASSGLAYAMAYGMSLMIYMMILLYGQGVFMSVMEEKTSRIVEIIVSSVKPIQLMLGKIIATGLVGISQILIWGVLLGIIQFTLFQMFGAKLEAASGAAPTDMSPEQQKMILNMMRAFDALTGPLLLAFAFYFVTAFLMYGSLYAAIGASVEQQSDAQQLLSIVMVPIILPILMLAAVILNPTGPLAFWLSVFPLTAPIIMMARMAATEVPAWEVALSMLLMISAVGGIGWIAARIYRVGLLLYGKKPSIAEFFKWAFIRT